MKADPAPTDLTERQAFIVLNALPGVGPIVLHRLLEKLGGDPRQVLAAASERLREVPGVRAAAIAALADWRRHVDIAAEERRLSSEGAEFIAWADPAYPEALRRIDDPPLGLYRRGGLGFDRPGLAIVGTRRTTHYGRAVARQLAIALAERDFCVVSGLAQGIDTAAHEGALEAGGRTLAVLGTGLDLVYPPENRALHRRIAEKGTLLSEFPLGRPASRQSFPRRNRIVSGLCAAVIVVESGLAGGAMITARFAGEQGKPIFAVPGRIDQPTSAGCHQLIRDGAALLTGVDDVLQELNYLGGFRPPPIAPKPGATAAAAARLSDDETRVLAGLAGGEILAPDRIAARTELPPERISAALVMLELKGFAARQLDGGYEAL